MGKSATLAGLACASLFIATLPGCGGGADTYSDFDKVDVTQPVTDWQLVWQDEFDGNSINASKWTHEINCAGGGNNEKQCYTDSSENAYVADGKLHIVALPAEEGAEKPFTSARLVTRNKADFKYGRFEMRAQLPFGQGSWPAFWMMPTDSVYGTWPKSGEIDIMEAVNLKVTGDDGIAEANVHGTLHYGRDWPNNASSGKGYSLPDGANPADDFHTYAIEWQEGEIRWYMDGYLYATQRQSKVRYNSRGEAVGLAHRGWYTEYFNQATGELQTHWDAAPFDQEFFMILNLAVGGNWPENVNNLGIDADAFANGQKFIVDYVRVYQCAQNPDTGKGCETVRAGYDKEGDALVIGQAPIPSPPSSGIAQNLNIFTGTPNPNWAAWDCCGGSTPALVADADRGVASSSGEVDLVEALRRALHLLEPECQRRSVVPVLQVPEPVRVRADLVTLDQILHNLLMNALQAMDGIDPSRRGLTLRVQRADGEGELSVADKGPGMAPDVLRRVFEPFFSTREGGLGLGLSLCESLAQGMGGSLHAANRPEGGAVFVLRLPLPSHP